MNRMKNRTVAKVLCCYLAVALFVIGSVEKSYAGFSPSEVITLSPFERTVDLEKIRAALETKVFTERLAQFGYSKDEIQSRLDQLSDQQLHKVALKIDQLKVGGDDRSVLMIVIVLLAVLLLLLIVHVSPPLEEGSSIIV
jgi:hypothetical protein